FMFAGNATLTFRSLRTGAHFTYKIPKNDRGENFYAKVLTGPDNTSDFTYIGMIIGGVFKTTAKSKMRRGSLPVDALTWALAQFQKNVMPDQMEVWHTGRCGRCGRELTVPESVATGIGPDCAAQMGKEQVKLTTLPKETRLAEESYREKTFRGVDPATQTYGRQRLTVDQELDQMVEARIASYRTEQPENFYQDGMLNLEEA